MSWVAHYMLENKIIRDLLVVLFLEKTKKKCWIRACIWSGFSSYISIYLHNILGKYKRSASIG